MRAASSVLTMPRVFTSTPSATFSAIGMVRKPANAKIPSAPRAASSNSFSRRMSPRIGLTRLSAAKCAIVPDVPSA